MSEGESFQEKYNRLLEEFNLYREKVITDKENQLRELQRYRAHMDKTYKQIQKKYDQKLQEQRVLSQKRQKKHELLMAQKQEQCSTIIENKNRFIEELKRRLAEHEAQRHQLIEDHTRMLYELCEDMESNEEVLGPGKNSYQDLVRLYQFVLQENNSLKKELFRVELRGKDIVTEDSKLLPPPKVPTIKQKDERKKKKTTMGSVDNSKIHNESIRPKTGQIGTRKEPAKRS